MPALPQFIQDKLDAVDKGDDALHAVDPPRTTRNDPTSQRPKTRLVVHGHSVSGPPVDAAFIPLHNTAVAQRLRAAELAAGIARTEDVASAPDDGPRTYLRAFRDVV